VIILDTNVISELMRPEPAAAVLQWMSAQPAGVLHVTTISYAEILFGLHVVPDGRRRQRWPNRRKACSARISRVAC
jgi:predicted nucleic acid-binding protein